MIKRSLFLCFGLAAWFLCWTDFNSLLANNDESKGNVPVGVRIVEPQDGAAPSATLTPSEDSTLEDLDSDLGSINKNDTDRAPAAHSTKASAQKHKSVPQVKNNPQDATSSKSMDKNPVKLEARVDKSVITIGEKVKYTISVESSSDVKVEFPTFGANLGGFAIKDFHITPAKKCGPNRMKSEQWYLLDTYTLGAYVIPPQAIAVTLANGTLKTLKSPEIFIEVKSVMKDSDKEKGLRDIKSPLNIPKNFSAWSITLLIISLVSLGIAGWMIYLKKFRRVETAPPVPPHETALHELKQIEGMDLIRQGKIKEHYYLVSNCLRTYLENRFSLHAPEQTTEEFLEDVAHGNKLEGHYINLLNEYLKHCDLVKYAKLEPEHQKCHQLINTTRKFILETKPAERAAEEDPDEVNA